MIVTLVAELGACAAGPPTYSAQFPGSAEPGTVVLKAEPVDLVDFTGLVTGIAIAGQEFTEDAILVVPGDQRALRVSWTGGACEDRVRLVLSETATGLALVVDADPSLAGMLGCPALGVPRSVIVTFNRAIEPRDIAFTQRWD